MVSNQSDKDQSNLVTLIKLLLSLLLGASIGVILVAGVRQYSRIRDLDVLSPMSQGMRLEHLKEQTSRMEELGTHLRELQLRMQATLKVKPETESVQLMIADLAARLADLEEHSLGLRQAINPSNPEEVLTIARLKDSINDLSTKMVNLETSIKEDQESFQASVVRELQASGKSTNMILIVLVPIVLNLFYNIWKDRKQTSKKVDTE